MNLILVFKIFVLPKICLSRFHLFLFLYKVDVNPMVIHGLDERIKALLTKFNKT